MNDLMTVDQLAQFLDMHPRTIRRYIRDGQLKASKVGGEWRILKDDAEMFIGGKVKELQNDAMEDVAAYLEGKDSELTGRFQVCTVLDCYVNDSAEALRISEIFVRNMNERKDAGKAKFQYFFVKEEQKGRYILWSDPAFAGKVLSEVGEQAMV